MDEANAKVERMQYVFKKASRHLDVERGDLDHERSTMESELRRNVKKIGKTLQRMNNMRHERNKLAGDVNAVTKRLNFEKECVTSRLLFEKEVATLYPLCVSFYLIPFFLLLIEAVHNSALKYKAEKKESNMKRRKVETKMRILQLSKQRLKNKFIAAQKKPTLQDITCHTPYSVRFSGRNRGMTPQFEAHVRNMMATGGSARQVRDNLVLNATHFLGETESLQYTHDIPTERWFSLQREALGVWYLMHHTILTLPTCILARHLSSL